jgi:hypothetical protein
VNHKFHISLPANQPTFLARLKMTVGGILVAVIILAILAAALILGSLIALAIAAAMAIALAAGIVKLALQRKRGMVAAPPSRELRKYP